MGNHVSRQDTALNEDSPGTSPTPPKSPSGVQWSTQPPTPGSTPRARKRPQSSRPFRNANPIHLKSTKHSNQNSSDHEGLAEAMSLKELGNEHFKAGKFAEAESLYSQAISHAPSTPQLFSNRSLCRIRLDNHNGAELDARKAIELYGPKDPSAMRSYYFLAQAQLGLNHPLDALGSAKISYRMCLEQRGRDAEAMSQFILRTKQEIWRRAETSRLRGVDDTLREVEELLEEKMEKDLETVEIRFHSQRIGETGREEEKADIRKEAAIKLQTVREAFAKGREDLKERAIPDYLLDPISFEVMHDPVLTPAGTSYDRVSILKHLKVSSADPVTRQPLSEKQLRPNIALKEVSAEFLERNGWAVDY